MFNIGATFIFSVISFYTFYRYILEQNEFFEQVTVVHFYWQIFYLIYAYMIIYAGSVVNEKVNELKLSILSEFRTKTNKFSSE